MLKLHGSLEEREWTLVYINCGNCVRPIEWIHMVDQRKRMAENSLQCATSYRGSFRITGIDVPDENEISSALKLFCELEG